MDDFFKSKKGIIIIYILGILFLIYLSEYKKLNTTILFTLFSITIPFFEKAMTEEYKIKLNKGLEDYKNGINEKMENQKKELNKELEEYKTKLSGYTLVTKMQFELEFKIYTEIYEVLFEVQRDTENLATGISDSDDYSGRLNIFTNSYNNSRFIVSKYVPFYSKEIYICIKNIQKLFFKEARNIELSFLMNIQNFDYMESMDRKNKIKNEMEILSTLIRDRIQNMKIVE